MSDEMNAPDLIDGTCDWCGNETAVWSDNRLCEDCDSNIVMCSICKERQHRDDSCRHVFQDENFEWTGSGAYEPSEQVAASFAALVKAMPVGFAADLRTALRAQKFHTWLVAPLIGGGGYLTLNGIPPERACNDGDRMLELGECDDAEAMADGYRWLASLYDDHTPAANETTIRWIDNLIPPHPEEARRAVSKG